MERWANRSRRELQFTIGDQVWLSTKNLPLRVGTRKLASIWAGPFEIVQVIGHVAYRLGLPEDWKIHDVFHVSQLKRVLGTVAREDSLLVDGGEEFEVEQIVGMRMVKGAKQYLVKWKGFEDFNNTWVAEMELDNAQQAIRDYISSSSRMTRTRRGSGVRD